MDLKHINYYWDLVGKILDSVSKYNQAVRLQDNLNDPETAWKVQDVFSRYYKGSIDKLNAKIASEKSNFLYYVGRFNNVCRQNGLLTVTKPETLFELLAVSTKRRSYYRQRINFYIANSKIASLQSIEQDFLAKRRPHL